MKTDSHELPHQPHSPHLFRSFFQGSFPCSTACRGEGKRVDLVVNSGHDILLEKDYSQMAEHQLMTVRDGTRWYLIEKIPGEYDWSTFLPVLHAAENHQIEVIWELAHFGWPDNLDIFQPEFVDRFAAFSRAFARLLRQEGYTAPFITPVNQISFWAWAGADVALFNPNVTGQGRKLKLQLVRASLAAMRAIRAELPDARFVVTDPLVNIVAQDETGAAQQEAQRQHEAQYEVWDMLAGRLNPELGGDESLLDIIGLTWYPDNQWTVEGETLNADHPDWRGLSSLLNEVWQRYQRPLLIAETGAEGTARGSWLNTVADEVNKALNNGVQVEGVSIYPAVDYPSWADDRRAPGGLLGLPDPNGNRTPFEPYALALRSQQIKMKTGGG